MATWRTLRTQARNRKGRQPVLKRQPNCLSVAFLIVALEVEFALLGWLIWRLI